jgi:hypothetical protein
LENENMSKSVCPVVLQAQIRLALMLLNIFVASLVGGALATGTAITPSAANGRNAVCSGACRKRRQQDEDLHIHAKRNCLGHCLRAAGKIAARSLFPGEF